MTRPRARLHPVICLLLTLLAAGLVLAMAVEFRGLTHTPVGGSTTLTLAGTAPDDTLTVDNPFVGPFGVEIALPAGTISWAAVWDDYDPVDVLPAPEQVIEVFGVVGGMSQQAVATLTVEKTGAGNYEVLYAATPIGATTYRYELWQDDVLIASADGQTLPVVATGPATAIRVGSLARGPAECDGTIDLGYLAPRMLRLPGQTFIAADRLVVVPEGVTPFAGLDRVDMTLEGFTTLTLIDELAVNGDTSCPDVDSDGYADCLTDPTCDPAGQICGDCDDAVASTSPVGFEICDGIDNNCDASIDEEFADTDGDGVADCVDCAPMSNSISTAPGPLGLTVNLDADTVTVRWLAEEQSNTYHVFSGSLASLALGSYDHSCLASTVPDTETMDATVPAAGDGRYYLVAPVNPCGVGGLGIDSDGGVRPFPGALGQCLTGNADSDSDGVMDTVDNCPLAMNADQADVELDGVGDACDNCMLAFNPDQADGNGNDIGNACEDLDGDGFLADVDCDDADAGVFPGGEGPAGSPSCSDGIDNDCDDALIDMADTDCVGPLPWDATWTHTGSNDGGPGSGYPGEQEAAYLNIDTFIMDYLTSGMVMPVSDFDTGTQAISYLMPVSDFNTGTQAISYLMPEVDDEVMVVFAAVSEPIMPVSDFGPGRFDPVPDPDNIPDVFVRARPATTGPVLTHSGEVVLDFGLPSSSIPGRGSVSWSSGMLYRSQIDFEGCVGYGWNMDNVTDHVSMIAGGGMMSSLLGPGPESEMGMPLTGIVRYQARGGRLDVFSNLTGTARGTFRELSSDLASQEIYIDRRDGFRATYNAFQGQPDDGALTRLRDRNGNRLELNHNGLGQLTQAVDAMGREAQYAYDGLGRLMEVTDLDNRVTTLGYDAFNNLVSVTTPAVTGTPNSDDGIGANGPSGNDFPAGKTYQFRYDTTSSDTNLRHNLLGITFPNEVATGVPERVTFTFGSNPLDLSTYDRVIQMSVGGGQINTDPVTGMATGVPAGGTYTFAYQDLAPRVPGDLVTEIRKTTVTDPNGNVTEHYFNADFHEVRTVVLTNRNVNPQDPANFTTLKAWSPDSLLTTVVLPEGNTVQYEYDTTNPNRFSQGNLLRVTSLADARGGDQSQLTTSYTYEPIYNRLRTVTTARGNDTAFVSPLPDDGLLVNPVDFNLDNAISGPDETTRRFRYTTTELFDYQEGTSADILALATSRGVSLDLDGAGPQTAQDTADALSLVGGTATDANGDGATDQQRGKTIIIQHPTVQLVGGGGQALLETFTYNDLGQLTSRADPEGNLTSYYYYPESDPDGDGMSQGLVRPGVDTVTGGYLRAVIADDDPALAASPGGDPQRPQNQPLTNNGTTRRTRPAPNVQSQGSWAYDAWGNVVRRVNPRGIETVYAVNQLNQIVEVVRANAHGVLTPDPAEPLALTEFQYRQRFLYDFNDNVIRVQVEDRGNTSTVGGDNAGTGTAFVDTIHRYDLLDRLIESFAEVDDSLDLMTRYRYDANGNQVLTIQPEGNAGSAVFDERDLVFQSTRGATAPPALVHLGVGDPVGYDVRGGTAATVTFTYDDNSNLVERADAADTDGKPANNSAIPGAGDRSRFLYDGFDRRTSAVDSVGNQSVLQYDPDSNVARTSTFGPVSGPSPSSDGPNILLQPVSSLGTIQAGNLVTSNLMAATEMQYDEVFRAFQIDRVLFVNTIPTLRAPNIADGATSLGKGNLTPGDNQVIPGVGGVTIIGRVSTRTGYDRNSAVVDVTEDDLDVTSYAYDGLDRRTRTTDAEGNRLEVAYDDNSNVIEVQETDVSQVAGVADEIFVTTSFYDALDRLQQSVDNIGQSTSFRYDSRSNLVAAADGNGPVTGASIARRAFAGGAGTVNAINDFGNVTRTTYDGLGRPGDEERILTAGGVGDGTNIGADIFGVAGSLPTPDTGQGGGDGRITVSHAWDLNSLPLHETDDSGNRTTVVFDNLDRQVSLTRGLCVPPMLADRCDTPTARLYGYDPDDNLVSRTDENGSVVVCSHDAVDRPVDCMVTPGPGVVGTDRLSYSYDGLSRMVDVRDSDSPAINDDELVAFAYDSLGRIIEEQQTINLNVGATEVVSSSWRAENLRASVTYPNNRLVESTYDGLDRLHSTQDAGAPDAIAEYDYIGRRVLERRYPQNGTRLTALDATGTVDDGYDALRRPVDLRHLVGAGTVLLGFEHTYDRVNNYLAENKQHDSANGELVAYDSAYRPVDFQRGVLDAPLGTVLTPSTNSLQAQTWSLDGPGNWSSTTSTTAGVPTVENREHSSFNEIIETDSGMAVPVLSDDNGNETDNGNLLFAWDFRNRLREVRRKSDNKLIATYSYDGLDRRVSRSVSASGALDGSTSYYHDGARVIDERNAALGNVAQQEYVYGIYVDEPLITDLDTNMDAVFDVRLHYHENGRHSVFGVTDGSGSLVEGYQYDLHGMPTVFAPGTNGVVDFGGDDVITIGGASDVGNPYLYTGRRLDPETDLYYFRARYLDTGQGRFLSRDPIDLDAVQPEMDGKYFVHRSTHVVKTDEGYTTGFNGGGGQRDNQYQTNFVPGRTDPSGRDPWWSGPVDLDDLGCLGLFGQQIKGVFTKRGHVDTSAVSATIPSSTAGGASAYTTGTSVVFGDGAPGPETVKHEAAHVVQQGGGGCGGPGIGAEPGCQPPKPKVKWKRKSDRWWNHRKKCRVVKNRGVRCRTMPIRTCRTGGGPSIVQGGAGASARGSAVGVTSGHRPAIVQGSAGASARATARGRP